jgi:hypothetical protein
VPNANPKDILTALESTLTPLVPDTIRQLVVGADSDPGDGFPYCRVFLDTVNSPEADTVSYERTWTFAVEVWQEYSQKSKRDAELDLANALHYVMNKLQGDWQLGIGVEGLEINASPVMPGQLNGAPARMCRLSVNVLTLVQNPS